MKYRFTIAGGISGFLLGVAMTFWPYLLAFMNNADMNIRLHLISVGSYSFAPSMPAEIFLAHSLGVFIVTAVGAAGGLLVGSLTDLFRTGQKTS